MASVYIYNNKDLMREIYLFDPTFRIFFRDNFVSNRIILEAAHDFWWKKYIKYLRMHRPVDDLKALRYILEIQSGFFDTLRQISPESFFGEDIEI
jgi:hypothetical protein